MTEDSTRPGGPGGSNVSFMREAARLDRRVDEEKSAREQELLALEGKMMSEMKRISSHTGSSLQQRMDTLEMTKSPHIEAVEQKVRGVMDALERETLQRFEATEELAYRLHQEALKEQRDALEKLEAKALLDLAKVHTSVDEELKKAAAEHASGLSVEQEARELAHKGLRDGVRAMDAALRDELCRLAGEQRRGRRELEDLLGQSGTELLDAHDKKSAEQRHALEALDAQMREDISVRLGRFDASQRQALEQMDAQLREELAKLSSDHKKGHKELSDLVAQNRSDIDVSLGKKHEQQRAALQEIEASLREEISGRNCKLDAAHKAALQLLKDEVTKMSADHKRAQASVRELFAEQQEDINGKYEKRSVEYRRALEALDERFTIELNGKNGKLDATQRAQLAELEATLRNDIASLGMKHEKSYNALHFKLAEHQDELPNKFAEHQLALDELDARLMEELNGRHGKIDFVNHSALQAVDDGLREELSRITGEHRHTLGALQALLEDHRTELNTSNGKAAAANRTAMQDMRLQLEDLAGQYLKVETVHRSSLQTVAEELREEIARGNKGKISAQKIDDLESTVQSELASHRTRLESQLRTTVQTVAEELNTEIARIGNEIQSRSSALQDQIAAQRVEVEVNAVRLHAAQEEQRENVLHSLQDIDVRLRSELSKLGHSTDTNIAFQVDELRSGLAVEARSRIEHERRVEALLAKQAFATQSLQEQEAREARDVRQLGKSLHEQEIREARDVQHLNVSIREQDEREARDVRQLGQSVQALYKKERENERHLQVLDHEVAQEAAKPHLTIVEQWAPVAAPVIHDLIVLQSSPILSRRPNASSLPGAMPGTVVQGTGLQALRPETPRQALRPETPRGVGPTLVSARRSLSTGTR